MRIEELPLAGAHVLVPEPVEDARGLFARTFDREALEGLGLRADIVQESVSWNRTAGTVRGMHLQLPPHAEVKFVRCTRGAILDAIVDLRPESRTFGMSTSVRLDAENRTTLYVPERFAHGYQVLEDDTELSYAMTARFEPSAGFGIRHDDPALAITWPLPVGEISERDKSLPTLAEAEGELRTALAPGNGAPARKEGSPA